MGRGQTFTSGVDWHRLCSLALAVLFIFTTLTLPCADIGRPIKKRYTTLTQADMPVGQSPLYANRFLSEYSARDLEGWLIGPGPTVLAVFVWLWVGGGRAGQQLFKPPSMLGI